MVPPTEPPERARLPTGEGYGSRQAQAQARQQALIAAALNVGRGASRPSETPVLPGFLFTQHCAKVAYMPPMPMPPSAPPPGMPPPGGAGAPPLEAGMQQPQKANGQQAMADVNVKLAMDILTNTLPMFGADSEKGACILDVLRKLSKDFGAKMGEAKQLAPAEIAQLLQSSGAGPKSPLQGAPAGGPPMGGPPGGGAPGMM